MRIVVRHVDPARMRATIAENGLPAAVHVDAAGSVQVEAESLEPALLPALDASDKRDALRKLMAGSEAKENARRARRLGSRRSGSRRSLQRDMRRLSR